MLGINISPPCWQQYGNKVGFYRENSGDGQFRGQDCDFMYKKKEVLILKVFMNGV